MRKLLAICFVFLISQSGNAQNINLEIKGDVKIVKVDKVIVVKEDRTVVQTLPFTVKAPTGKGLYFWQYPHTVVALDKNDELEVITAPKGPLTIAVKAVSAKLDKDGRFIGFNTELGQVTFDVGGVTPPPPPPPPDPDPDPDTSLVKTLRSALAKESVADREKLPKLIEIYKTAADYSKDTRFTTAEQINVAIKAVREKTIGTALANVRSVINAELQKTLPTTPTPLNDAQRKTMQDTFNLIADSLNQLIVQSESVWWHVGPNGYQKRITVEEAALLYKR